MAEFITNGIITNNGKLQINTPLLADFIAKHKGKKIIVKISPLSDDPSEALRGYYFNYVLPTCQKGFIEIGERITIDEVDETLRNQSPFCQEIEYSNGHKHLRIKEINELKTDDFCNHIEWVKQYASENLYTIIEDPK